jgi:hypothetical protein
VDFGVDDVPSETQTNHRPWRAPTDSTRHESWHDAEDFNRKKTVPVNATAHHYQVKIIPEAALITLVIDHGKYRRGGNEFRFRRILGC